jgi:hypothetical protein
MARRTAQRAAKTLASTKLVGGVHVSASLTRKKATPAGEGDYYRHMNKLYVDPWGNLVAVASCGDEAFVANPEEIKILAEFLTKIAADVPTAK